MQLRTRRRMKWIVVVATALGGGSLFASCQMRLHDSIVNGTKLWFASLLDPSNIVITNGDTTGN